MVILNSKPEDVNFYQENMIHDVGHDYFGSGTRVKEFENMKKMVDTYLRDFKIQSGGFVKPSQYGLNQSLIRQKYLEKNIPKDKSKKLKISLKPNDKSVNVEKLKKRLENLSFVEEISFSEYMEKNIRPILQNVFYQLHFYYYTLRFNLETLKFDKDVPESVFGDELK